MPKLSILHRKQIDYGYCLPACVEMVLALYGLNRTQQEIAQSLGTIPDFGTPAPNILRLQSRTLAVSRQIGDPVLLVDALARNVPPIVEVDTRFLSYWDEACLHVILIAAMGDDSVLIHDPAFDEPKTIHLDDLLLAWIEKDNQTILIERR